MALDLVGGIWYYDFRINGQRYRKSTGIKNTGKVSEGKALAIQEKAREKIVKELTMTPREKEEEARKSLYISAAIQKTYDEHWFEKTEGVKICNRLKLLIYPRYNNKAYSFEEAERLRKEGKEVKEPYLQDQPIINLTDTDIVNLKKALLEEGKAPATVNRMLAHFKTVYNHLGIPRPKMRLMQEPGSRVRFLTYEEEEEAFKLISEMGQPKIRALCEILVETGARLNEIVSLSYRDIDFRNDSIYLGMREGSREKHGNPTTVPMNHKVRGILLALRADNFPKPFGDLDLNYVEKVWRRVRTKMGLQEDKQFVIHALRHTCASRLVQADVPLLTVKKLLGHSTLKVTEKYAHLRDVDLIQAMKTKDEAKALTMRLEKLERDGQRKAEGI